MYSTLTDLLHLLLTWPLLVVVAGLAAALQGWRRGPGHALHRWRWVLLGGAVFIHAVTAQVVSNQLVNAVEATYAVPDARLKQLQDSGVPVRIVVLSGGWFRAVPGGLEVHMGNTSWERTWAAVAQWRRLGGRLIFSGAPLPDGSDSVAHHMAAVAAALGVPASQIGVEPASHNTYENLLFTQRCCLNGPGGASAPVLLVTSALHLPRAVAIARHLGLEVIPVPCDWRGEQGRLHWRAWLPSNDGAGELEQVLHEIVGLWVYRLRGWA